MRRRGGGREGTRETRGAPEGTRPGRFLLPAQVPAARRAHHAELDVGGRRAALAGERAWIKCVGQPASGGGGDDGPVEGKGGDDPSNVKEKPKETYRADAEAVFVKYVEKLRRREAQAREAMEDGEAMDEGVYDAQDDEDVAVELRRRKRGTT